MSAEKNRWVDTHCHLEMLKEDPAGALEKGREQGLCHSMTIGTNHETNQAVLGLCAQFGDISGALGIHPHYAKDAEPAHFDFIEKNAINNPRIIAIGECGLDFFYTLSEAEPQKEVFVKQLQLAIKHNLPVVIHSRSAEQETLDCLAQVDVSKLRGVFHSFTSSLDMAQKILEMGFYISFNGICTFPKSDEVREVLKQMPLDRILLETDSPYLSPVPFRGKPNVPGNVSVVGEFVADFLGLEAPELAQRCYTNSKQLFGFVDVG